MNTFLSAYSNQTSLSRTILNISSGAAQRAVDGWGAYSASKAALDVLTRTAQKEQDLRNSGIQLRSLSPSVLDTSMQEHIRTADEQHFSEVNRFAGLQSEGQLVDPSEAASRIVAWLQELGVGGEDVILRLENI